MGERLNELLIGKVRHNLKTHLNIICGFSELLCEEIEDFSEDDLAKKAALLEALETIKAKGDDIVKYIDQVFASHHFTLEDVFAQLNAQAAVFERQAAVLIVKISEALLHIRALDEQVFLQAFEQDLQRIDGATRGLQQNLKSLLSDKVNSVESLVGHGILSQSDLELVASLSDSLQETPDALETKYPSTILVVDDNPANTEYLRRKLTASGHQVIMANSGQEAEAQIAAGRELDLILLDILMPGLSGYEVLGRNHDLLRERNIPVLVVSSLDEQDTVYRCLEAGAEDFITKPINFMVLAARINSALERKYLLDREEEHLARIESEKQRNEELLLNILPQPIAMRMKANEYLIADAVEECSILFGDIVGFTPLSQKLGAVKIVEMLNQIFTCFDDYCEDIGLEKIKTIGDNYMVASGVPTPDADHASKIMEMGVRMLDFVTHYPPIEGSQLQMRIGIHSGPAVAGVIGKKKFVYDLWGDAVNTAGRMESYGLPGAVHVSAATAELLKGRFDLQPRGEMEVKGKGIMQTFLWSPPG